MAINSLQSHIGTTDEYLVTEGLAMIAPLDDQDTISGGFENLGSLTDISFAHTFTEVEIKETQTGNGLTAASFITDKEVEVTLTFKSFSAKNLELLSLGNSTLNAAAVAKTGSQTIGEQGKYYRIGDLIDSSNTAPVFTGTGGTPTYVEGTDYQYDDGGYFFVVEGGAITASSEVEYTYDTPEYNDIQAFQNNVLNKFMSFDAVNKLTGEHVLVEVAKLAINPSDAIPFLSPDAEGTATLTGKALISTAYPNIAPYNVKKK